MLGKQRICYELFGGFLHELSTPLTTLLLQAKLLPSDQFNAVSSSAELIDDTISMMTFLLGKCSLAVEQTRTKATFQEVAAGVFGELSGLAQAAKVKLHSPNPSAEILWHPVLTELAIRAIIRLSIGFASPGATIEFSKPNAYPGSFKIEIHPSVHLSEVDSGGHMWSARRFRYTLTTLYCEQLARLYGEEFSQDSKYFSYCLSPLETPDLKKVG